MNEAVVSTTCARRHESRASQVGELRVGLAAFVDAQLQRAATELARPRAQIHSGVHEARKALRRSQAALRLGNEVLPARAKRMRKSLCRIGRSLSALRDAQALVEALERLALRSESARQVARAGLEYAIRRRDFVLDRTLAADPELQLRRTQLAGIAAQLVSLDWKGLTAAEVSRAVSRSRRKVLNAFRQTQAQPEDDDAWHRLRRRIRRLRHQSDLLPAAEQHHSGVTADDDALARMLGEAQDEVLLIAACRRGSPFPLKLRRALLQLAESRLREIRAAAG